MRLQLYMKNQTLQSLAGSECGGRLLHCESLVVDGLDLHFHPAHGLVVEQRVIRAGITETFCVPPRSKT